VETEELTESVEKAGERKERKIGVTMAIVAVLLALATMLGHRTHTEEVLIQTRANDQWAYYQAKTIRAHMYEADAEMAALLPKGEQLAESFKQRSEDQKKSAEEVRNEAQQKENETDATSRKAGRFDTAEIFLEIAIVLCSISLLARSRVFWLVSFASSAVGVMFMIRAFLM
jgi:gas vesicle protein